MEKVIKELLKCVGKYKLPSILAPLFITGEVVKGRMPKKYNEVVVMVDENNQITDYV